LSQIHFVSKLIGWFMSEALKKNQSDAKSNASVASVKKCNYDDFYDLKNQVLAPLGAVKITAQEQAKFDNAVADVMRQRDRYVKACLVEKTLAIADGKWVAFYGDTHAVADTEDQLLGMFTGGCYSGQHPIDQRPKDFYTGLPVGVAAP